MQADFSATSFHMQSLRDNPDCAREEYETVCDESNPGLSCSVPESAMPLTRFPSVRTERPAVAILREQGVNGHTEMAGAFDAAGFDAIDVHMSDLISAP